jgi:beta-lactamase regulating signal transducer with metallopeptidase domain
MAPSSALFVLPGESIEWLQLLLDMVIKGVFILLVAGALVATLKRASAAARHLLWSVAVACMLALPVFELVLPDWQVPVFPGWLQSASAKTGSPAISPTQTPENQLAAAFEENRPPANSHAPVKEPLTAKPSARKTLDELPTLPPYQTPLFEDVRREQSLAVDSPKGSMNWAMIIFLIWLAGFLAVMTRLLVGTFKVWKIARRAEPLTDRYWAKLLDDQTAELGLSGRIAMLKTRQVTMPMTWGVFRPVVLLPMDADDWSEECSRIVLLHELAHIKRRDCLTQMLAQLACALHWFNPLVWSAAKRLRVERELACDDQVLEVGTRASDYASHLLAIASSFEANIFASATTVGMACSQLESRVVSILNPDIKRRGLSRFGIIFVSLVAAFLIVPLAVVQPWVNATEDEGLRKYALSLPGEQASLLGKTAFPPPKAFLHNSGQVEPDSSTVTEESQLWWGVQEAKNHDLVIHQQAPDFSLLQTDANLAKTVNLIMVEANIQEKAAPKAEGEGNPANPSNEQNQRLKLFGVTPEFIESARQMGFENLSVNQLIQMRVHQIDQPFVTQVRGWGFANASLNQLVQLRVSGVTSEYIEALKRAGIDNLPLNRLASMKLHNVTPDYIDELRRLGFDKLSVDQLISLKVHRINEAFVREAQNWGFGKLSLNELLQLRVHNVTPNFAQEMKALGFDNLSLQRLMQLRVHNVNAEYLREMRDLGFDNLTAEQAIQMRVHGITAEYVKKLRAAGFKNVSLKQMLDMKLHGIDEILLKNNR